MTAAPIEHPDPVQRFARVAGPVLVFAAAVSMLAWTWFKWPDPVVDFGRELYVPWQLSQGKVLYRDIAYFNGPLSPYFNTLVFLILGVSLRSLVLVNIVILAVIVVLIGRLWRIIADRLTATLAGLLVVTVFAFLQFADVGNYNFVTPYSHELTHGIALSLAGMLCVEAYLRNPRGSMIAVAGLLLGLIFLTKPEVFVAVGVAIAAGLTLGLWTQRASARRALRVLSQLLASALVPPLLAFVLLSLAMSPIDALRGTLGAWAYLFDPSVSGMTFYRRVIGVADLPNNLHAMLENIIWWTAVFGGVAAVSLSLRAPRFRRARMWLIALPLFAALFSLIEWRSEVRWERAFRGLSLLMLITTVGLLIAALRRGARTREAGIAPVARFMIALFALLLLGKIFFNVMITHYGFALAMPAMLVMTALLVSWWPNWIDRRGGSGVVLRAAAVAGVLFVIQLHLRYYYKLAADKQVVVGTGPDAFFADVRRHGVDGRIIESDHRGKAVNLALESLRRLPRDATLATIPEGTMINYLSRRTNSTRFINLMPPEVLMFGQDRILDAFKDSPPDYILLVLGSNPADFGYKSFASDYGATIFQWIRQNYRHIPTPQEPSYPLMLMEKRRDISN